MILARKEGLFVGGSCGAAVWGAMNYIKKNPLKPDDLMVIILPDSGTRYISKVYNDEWMRTNGFLDDRQVPELDEVIKVNDSRDRGLVTVDMDETLDDAIKRMNDHNISQLPVSSGDKLVGSLTENQILGLLTQQTNVRNKKVGEVMEEPFPVVSADLKVDQITRMLSDGQPAVILRLDDGRHTIITRSDLINAMSKSG